MGLRDCRENRWAPDKWKPGKNPLFKFYHDQLLLAGFNHPSFAVLETVSEKLNKLFTVNLILDAWKSFSNEQSSSFHPKKVGLKPLSTSGDRKFTENAGACVFHSAWPGALQAQGWLTSANEQAFFWSGSVLLVPAWQDPFPVLLNDSHLASTFRSFPWNRTGLYSLLWG